MADRQGCLLVIFQLLGLSIGRTTSPETALPYRLRDDFLSDAELSFYRVLTAAIGNEAIVLCKVRLGDLFFVPRSDGSQGDRNRINSKHVDFVLCDPVTMRPKCGLELDDSSHGRPDRRERDEFVEAVFAAAGLPLERVAARRTYRPAELLQLVRPHMSAQVTASAAPSLESPIPRCRKCGILMVERVARKGERAGQQFFGCPNFPKCREIA